MDVRSHQAETSCPGCGRGNLLHASTTGGQAAPVPGALSVCWRCRAVGIFEMSPLGVLTLREPTAAEEVELNRNEQLARALAAMKSSGSPTGAAHRAAASERANG